jgi:hypothetical protein
MVCVTDAAGLGVRGVVITPCADTVDSRVAPMAKAILFLKRFDISCGFKLGNDTIYTLEKNIDEFLFAGGYTKG